MESDMKVVPLQEVTLMLIEIEAENRHSQPALDSFPALMSWVWSQLGKQQDFKEIFNLETLWDKPSLRKSWADAERYRLLGNEKFATRNLNSAETLYNKAIFASPHYRNTKSLKTNNTLALALANRSLVMFERGMYKESLFDMREALDQGYPNSLAYKLYTRQGKCFKKLAKPVIAKACFEKANEFATKYIEDKEKCSNILNDIATELITLDDKSHVSSKSEEPEISANPELPPLPSPHPQFPSLSSKLKVVYSAGKGRHIVAAGSIAAGEVLLVDKALVTHLSPRVYATNCLHCFQATNTPLPCPSCSSVCFCSSRCRDEAMTSYHKYECKLAIKDLYDKEDAIKSRACSSDTISTYSGMFLQLRSIIQKDLSFFLENRDDLSIHDKKCGSNSSLVYSSSDYTNLYNLVEHNDEGLVEQMWLAVLSAFLLQCLQYTGWLSSLTRLGGELSDTEVYVASVLKHMRGVCQSNCHLVANMTSYTQNQLNTQQIGLAIRPSAALLNHSCWPNTTRCSNGSSIVLIATARIYPGEEVNDIYTESFHKVSKEERRKNCQKYKFECQCQACTQDWPVLSQLPSSISSTPASMFRPHITNELLPIKANSLTQLQKEAVDLLSKREILKATSKWSEFYDGAHDLLRPPSRSFVIVVKYLQICLWILHGSKASDFVLD